MHGSINNYALETIFYYLAIFFTITTIWLLWPDTITDLRSDSFVAQTERIPDYYMHNLRYVAVKETKRQMELFADWGLFDMEKQEMLGENVLVHLFNDEGQYSIISGNKGRFLTNKQYVYLKENVYSESADGFVMTGEEAELDMAKKFLVSPIPVAGHSKEGNMKVWGDKGDSNFSTNISHLYGNAKVHHWDEKGKLTKVRGDTATIQRNDHQIDFDGNVVVDQDDLTMTSKVATMYYLQESKPPVKYMIARSDVVTKQVGGRETHSQVAEFFTPTNTIVLTVFPTLYDRGDMVSGDKITLYRSTGVVEVTEANAALTELEQRKAEQKNKNKNDKKTKMSDEDDESELAP